MASHFNLQELSDTISSLQRDDLSSEQNAACSREIESKPFSLSTGKVPKVSSAKSTDCSVAKEPPINIDKPRQKIRDLTSDEPLSYLTQLLLEEDVDDKISTYEEELALLATEKTFLEILRQDYYSSPDEALIYGSLNQKNSVEGAGYEKSNGSGESELIENDFDHDASSLKPPLTTEDPTSALPVESLTAQQIQKGVEEAMKFLPDIGEFFDNKESSGIGFFQETKKERCCGRDRKPKNKRNTNCSDLDQLEGRARKQIMAYSDEPIRNENFDEVLLLGGRRFIEEDTMIREAMQKEMRRKSEACTFTFATEHQTNQTMKELVDLRYLLIQCSQAVSTNDVTIALDLMNLIRKHSSPNGDWSQRLAHYFVDALEARLAGTGSEIYRKIISKRPTVIDILKAYRLFFVASPCKRAQYHFSNQTIRSNISKDAQKVHIINYGIIHGFQWPPFFEHFASWENTPPKIRITVIEVPEPGFRPRKRVELIGRRLADYAKSFNVPFEYEGIVSKWENVKIEDLKIGKDEVVVVNCLVHSEKLSDEVTSRDSPRDIFLQTIKKIKPCVFIHGIINGSYNSPYFVTRFKSALLHYSSLFDILDSNLPRDNQERLRIERDLLIPGAINAIACEGSERVERPETYKRWHTRKLRAGLMPVPVDSLIKKNVKNLVQWYHHKDFVVDDDNGWLLVGWKGRILYGLSTWKSNEG